MQAKITLAFLAVSLLCGFHWVFSQLQTSKSAEISENSIYKVTLQRLGALGFSCHFLPFVNSFFDFLYLAVGSESMILIININLYLALTVSILKVLFYLIPIVAF